MKGKTIVATGATSGIGEAAVLALAGLGARIVLVARDETRAKATIQKLEAKAPGRDLRYVLMNITIVNRATGEPCQAVMSGCQWPVPMPTGLP